MHGDGAARDPGTSVSLCYCLGVAPCVHSLSIPERERPIGSVGAEDWLVRSDRWRGRES